MAERDLASFGITNAETMVATPAGFDMLSDPVTPMGSQVVFPGSRPARLIDYIRAYARNPDRADETFAGVHALEGNQSQLYCIGEHPQSGPLLLKVSTPTTIGGLSEESREYAPEDLVLQFRFLNSLRHLFRRQPETNIAVPEHHFAMRLDPQRSITVMQYFPTLIDVDTWLYRLERAKKMPRGEKRRVLYAIAERIQAAVTDPDYDTPLGDLWYQEEMEGEDTTPNPDHILRAENVLIEQAARTDDIEFTPLKVIDYPPPFGTYAAAARVAIANTNYYPHDYVEWNRDAA